MEPIWVEYERTVDDAVATTMHGFCREPSVRSALWIRRIGLLPVGVVLLIFGYLAVSEWANGGNIADVLTYVIVGGALVAFVGYVYIRGAGKNDPRAMFREHYSKPENQWQFGRHAAGVTDGGFIFVTPHSETRFLWHGIEDVLADEDAVSVWIGGLAMGSVPRRAFADEASFQRFVDAAHRKVAQAKATRGSDGRPQSPHGR